MRKRSFPSSPLVWILSAFTLAACGGDGQSGMPQMPPTEVNVVEVTPQLLNLSVELPGRTRAYRQADIRPQVSGIIEKRLFIEGSEVEAGQQLFQIEEDVYRASLLSAQAEVQRSQAALALARLQRDRLAPLAQSGRISKQENDQAIANFDQAAANLAAAEARLESAQINLRYARVLAPISGSIGRSNVTEGALVTALQTQELATIQQLNPIYVDVSRSADQLIELRQKIARGELANSDSTVNLKLPNGAAYEHVGKLELTEVDVDESTGTVTLRATFPNPDRILLPGMFVTAEVIEAKNPQAILVPQQSVMRGPTGNAFVWLANDSDQVEMRSVATGRAVGNQWLIESGLSNGERVITTGFQKIRPGATVSAVVTEAQ